MYNEKLHALLEDLHDQIENGGALSPREMKLLKEFEADIRHQLEHEKEVSKPAESSSISNLERSLSQLEVDHPHLTMTISEILNILNNAGI